MKLNRAGALASLAAQIKSSVLLGLDKIQRSQAFKAIRDMKVAVHSAIAEKRTPGAFGSALPRQRIRRPKWARANSAACNAGIGREALYANENGDWDGR